MIFFFLIPVFSSTLDYIPPTRTPPERLYQNSLVYVDDKLFTFGGLKTDGSYSDSLCYFDLSTNMWVHIFSSSISKPLPRISSIFFYNPYEHTLILYGGMGENGLLDDVWEYWIEYQLWNELTFSGSRLLKLGYSTSHCFYHQNKYICAILGGLDELYYNTSLLLIDLETKYAYKYNLGLEAYSIGEGHTMVYYEEYLYVFNSYAYDENGFNEVFLKISVDYLRVEEIEIEGDLPEARFQYFGVIYEDIMHYLPGIDHKMKDRFKTSYWVFNLTSLEFSMLDLPEQTNWQFVGFAGVAQNNETIYCFAGLNEQTTNQLLSWEANALNPEITVISEDASHPKERTGHSLIYLAGFLYMFGGRDIKGELESLFRLNELWKLDLETEIWTYVEPYGDIPTGREGVSIGKWKKYFWIFGGETTEGLNDQMYFYSTTTNLWKTVTLGNEPPTARKGSCSVQAQNSVFIFGGELIYSYTSELWRFDGTAYEYHLMDEGKIPAMTTPKCHSKFENNSWYMYIYNGKSSSNFQPEYFYKYNLHTFEVEYIYVSPKASNKYSSCAVPLDNSVILYGGGLYNTLRFENLQEVDLSSGEVTNIDTHEIIEGAVCAYFQKSLYVFFGLSTYTDDRRTVLNSHYSYVSKISNEDENWVCSPGSSIPDCEICDYGTYNPDFNSTCKLCPVGSYLDVRGAIDKAECRACDYGTFNDIEGASFCKECNEMEYCPVGSSHTIIGDWGIMYSKEQPEPYESRVGEAGIYYLYLWAFVLGLGSLMVFLIMRVENFRKKIYVLDSFSQNHNYKLEHPMYLKKTAIGGFFTIVFYIIAIYIFINLSLMFEFDNVAEIKTSIPMAIIEDQHKTVNSELWIEITLFNYRDSCIYPSNSIYFIEFEFEDIEGEPEIEVYEIENAHCFIRIHYEEFRLFSDGLISFSSQEEYGYASYLYVNVTSSSSIPDQTSSIEYGILPLDEENVFRGFEETIFSFNMIPTIFIPESGESNEETGYHVVFDGVTYGAEATAESVYEVSTMVVSVELDLLSTAIQVERYYIQDLYTCFGAAIGSILGALSLMGLLMKKTEALKDKIEEKQKEEKEISKSERIKSEFRVSNVVMDVEKDEYEFPDINWREMSNETFGSQNSILIRGLDKEYDDTELPDQTNREFFSEKI